jgi:hypothetical protein
LKTYTNIKACMPSNDKKEFHLFVGTWQLIFSKIRCAVAPFEYGAFLLIIKARTSEHGANYVH